MPAAVIHDPAVRASIEARLAKLTADSKGQWGQMAVDQMLWHVNQALATALGRVQQSPKNIPIPAAVMRFAVLKMPWTKNAPTNPSLITGERHDFALERARCLALIADICARPVDVAPPYHPTFGQMTGQQQSQLHAKHLNHHLTQFGV
ncbi:MAG TPA: DUF1569 domain-containing protein [Vicinamibacterales bacterium]|nr:DUF1569 domain-containing protein [Vicinamibacterales bacterium]